jgi:hypothetical protein
MVSISPSVKDFVSRILIFFGTFTRQPVKGLREISFSSMVKALTACLQRKQEFPNSNVKLRDSYEKAPLRAH